MFKIISTKSVESAKKNNICEISEIARKKITSAEFAKSARKIKSARKNKK